jgi:predicted metal-dependent phosphoesterase TrpH
LIIDLHTHSTASDGTDPPAGLVAQAMAAGVDVLGLTDHDTTGGWREAEAALPPGLTLVVGAELSCVWTDGERPISLHLLGYLFDPDHAELRAERARLRDDRIGRGRAIVERMTADGLPVSWLRVQELAGGGAVGRPHIGRVLVENGVVNTVDEAFRQFLHSTSRYYVRKADTDVFTAIALVRAAGGVPVFAHPRARRRGRVVDDDVIAAMTAAGLVGLEVDHPDHAAADRARLRGLAADLGLVVTGASDYHGTNKSTLLAACTTEPAAYAALIDRNTARAPLGTPPVRRSS